MVSLRLGGNSIKGGTYICQHHLQTASDYTNLPRKRPTQPHNSHPAQPPRIRLHNGINEMRRSNSHTEHIASVDIGLLQNPLDDCVDARGHIRGSGRFAGCADPARWTVCVGGVDDGGVGVGAADVDADAIYFHPVISCGSAWM